MTLLEAFRQMGLPPAGGPPEGLTVIYEELQGLARKVGYSFRPVITNQDLEDAPGSVLLRLQQRRRKDTDPDSDAVVRAYLWKCLKNHFLDVKQRREREPLLGDPGEEDRWTR